MRYRALSRTQAILEYPLATGISVWAVAMGVLTLYGVAPSRTINALEHWQAIGWAIGVITASVTTFWGLFISRKVLTVARGMYLHVMTFAIYSLSIVAVTGFSNGGALASFLLIMAAVIGREGIVLRQRASSGVRGAQ